MAEWPQVARSNMEAGEVDRADKELRRMEGGVDIGGPAGLAQLDAW